MIIPSHLFVLQVRKAAQEAVKVLLEKPPGDMTHHPACGATAKFCVQQIEENGGMHIYLYGMMIKLSITVCHDIALVWENCQKTIIAGMDSHFSFLSGSLYHQSFKNVELLKL